ncbi:MAG: aspartate 1-decarboxylase [Kiritimatiellae bacterium]|nr:aspartate 1-decarboxylase [Kiritimatiellia bacterium]
MLLKILKAKLHRIRVTAADLAYEGSLTLDPDDMEAVGILPYEKILCADVENGNRFETYAIAGDRGSGVCCLNGAAAHQGRVGDRLIVMAFALMTEEETRGWSPRVKHFN